MGSTRIEKIYPTCEELSTIHSKIKCPQDNCNGVFHSSSNLNMHLIKHHKIQSNSLTKKDKETQYFCPVNQCHYSKGSQKCFTKLKYLKQHFLKVHALKGFVCKKCGKNFSTESFKNLHMKNCGKIFTCTCGLFYTSSEAILTHCKRKGKGHLFVERNEKQRKSDSNDTALRQCTNYVKPERFIYPKLTSDMSFPIHYIAAVALSELSTTCNSSKVVDKGMQTETSNPDFNKDIKNNDESIKYVKKKKNSQQTQTTSGKCRKLKISTETQTNCDFMKNKSKVPKTILKKRRKSMETQTKDRGIISMNTKNQFNSQTDRVCVNQVLVQENNKAMKENEELNVIETKQQDGCLIVDNNADKKWLLDNQFLIKKEMSSSVETTKIKNELFGMGTEIGMYNRDLDLNEYTSRKNSQYEPEHTSDSQIFDINRLCNIETQTEIESFLTDCNEDTTFTLCSSTETQTTDDFDSLLYSNMCTQTCEEVDQLFNFNFVHIETQTAFPDFNDPE